MPSSTRAFDHERSLSFIRRDTSSLHQARWRPLQNDSREIALSRNERTVAKEGGGMSEADPTTRYVRAVTYATGFFFFTEIKSK